MADRWGTFVALAILSTSLAGGASPPNGCRDTCPGTWMIEAPLGQTAPGSISAVASVPDGRLFIGLRSGGLWVFAPDAEGVYRWTRIVPSRGELASDRIADLVHFRDELWIGTVDLGVNAVNWKTGAWRRMNSFNSPLPSDVVNRLTVASPPSGVPSVWVSTNAGGANYYFVPDIGNPRWLWRVFTVGQGLPDNQVRDIAVQFEGNKAYTWFATWTGLVQWDGSTMHPYNQSCRMETADRIIVDRSNAIWFDGLVNVPGKGPLEGQGLATGILAYKQNGICRARPIGGGRVLWEHLDDVFGQDMSVDPAGRLWCGNASLMAIANGGWSHDRGRWCRFRRESHGIYSDKVSAVHALGEKTWFGHDDAARLSGYSPNWEAYRAEELNSSGTPTAVLLHEGIPYVGFAGAALCGVSWQPAEDGPWHRRVLGGNSAPVTALVRAGDLLWLGTDGNGIFALEMIQFDLTHWTPAGDFPSDVVRAIAEDREGRIWAATDAGLALRGNGYWMTFTSANSPLAADDLRALAVDSVGRVWIGTAEHGISIRDPNASGAAAWNTQDMTDGLPSNRIRALARAGEGMWAGTDAGAAQWDPSQAKWSIHNAASGALPHDSVLAIASDATNGPARVWVGTERGLARLESAMWTHYHVTGSTLGSDRVRYVAADGDRLLATSGSTLSIRRDMGGPLGEFPPRITSFSPVSGAPGTEVEITGEHFDDRGPEYNKVTVGTEEAGSGRPAPAAEILSVSATKILFRVPLLATKGRIRVVSHCLEAESTNEFDLGPRIDRVFPECVALGDVLTIEGAGFSSWGASKVKIGNGQWHTPAVTGGWESQTPETLRVQIQPDDTTGLVQVLTGNAGIATAHVTIGGTISVKAVKIQQGIEGTPLIWGKRTLVHLDLRTSGCESHITSGRLWWKMLGGPKRLGCEGIYSASPVGESVPIFEPETVDSDFDGVDFVAEFETLRSHWSELFPSFLFDGVEIEIENKGVPVLNYTIPASSFRFINTGTGLRFRCMAVFPPEGQPSTGWKEFWRIAREGMAHTARIYPQQDVAWNSAPHAWLTYSYSYITSGPVIISDGDDDNEGEVRSRVADLLDMSMGGIPVALVDQALKGPGSSEGRGSYDVWPFGGSTILFNTPGVAGKTIAHEGGHVVGLSDGDLGNEDEDNEHHSRYDEGVSHDDPPEPTPACRNARHLTFWSALVDQIGPNKNVYRLDGGAPYLCLPDVADPCAADRPKSLMSYAPDRGNLNTFLDPVEYQFVIDRLIEWRGKAGGPLRSPAGDEDIPNTLRLRGRLDRAGRISVSVSYVELSIEDRTRPAPGGTFQLILRGGDDSALRTHTFSIATESGDGSPSVAPFQLAIPFPDETRKAEIRKGDDLLWSRRVSRNRPQVRFRSPAGGAFAATETVPVSWSASDADGDSLQFALDYSADGGKTWHRVHQYLTGDSYDWFPGFLPPSDAALLRIRASDGFLTETAFSAPFTLLAHPPYVFIDQPKDGQVFTEGQRVDVSAGSMTSAGPDQGTFEWTVAGEALRERSPQLVYTFESPGHHAIQVTVIEGERRDTDEITVTVLPDYDRDGMPNDWELEHRLDPLDSRDTKLDSDGDGLSNLGELRFRTDPRDPDSDGDGISDGQELAGNSDPLDINDQPIPVPVLRVGAASIAFTVEEGDAASPPRVFWITNSGSGGLSWLASSNRPWLHVEPPAGNAPAEVIVTALPGDLGPGTYSGQVTFTAGGALDSPQILRVTLRVEPRPIEPLLGFIRGDSNASGAVDIADPVHALNYLFAEGAKPPCLDAADANDDGRVNIADPVYVLSHLFASGPVIPPPFPACGPDPTADRTSCEVPRACE